MKKFLNDMANMVNIPYQWGVGIGNSFGVSYTDGAPAKILKRAIFNVAAPAATVYYGFQLALSAAALVTAPFVAAPLITFGSAAVGVVLGTIFTPWIAGISEHGMKENIGFVKSGLAKLGLSAKSEKPYGRSYAPSHQGSQSVPKKGLVAKFKAALGLEKQPTPSAPVPKAPTPK